MCTDFNRNMTERHAACLTSIQICLHQFAVSCQNYRKTGAHCNSWHGSAVKPWQQRTHCISFMLTCMSWSSGWRKPSNAWAHQNFLPPAQRQRPCWNCTKNARYWLLCNSVTRWQECGLVSKLAHRHVGSLRKLYLKQRSSCSIVSI